MQPAFLIFAGVMLLAGLPLLVGAIAVGVWLRRSNRARALRPYIGAALAGATSFFAFFGALALLVAIALREQRQPDYFEEHPALPLLMIALGLLALFSACLCALFGAWTVWRLVQARAASSA